MIDRERRDLTLRRREPRHAAVHARQQVHAGAVAGGGHDSVRGPRQRVDQRLRRAPPHRGRAVGDDPVDHGTAAGAAGGRRRRRRRRRLGFAALRLVAARAAAARGGGRGSTHRGRGERRRVQGAVLAQRQAAHLVLGGVEHRARGAVGANVHHPPLRIAPGVDPARAIGDDRHQVALVGVERHRGAAVLDAQHAAAGAGGRVPDSLRSRSEPPHVTLAGLHHHAGVTARADPVDHAVGTGAREQGVAVDRERQHLTGGELDPRPDAARRGPAVDAPAIRGERHRAIAQQRDRPHGAEALGRARAGLGAELERSLRLDRGAAQLGLGELRGLIDDPPLGLGGAGRRSDRRGDQEREGEPGLGHEWMRRTTCGRAVEHGRISFQSFGNYRASESTSTGSTISPCTCPPSVKRFSSSSASSPRRLRSPLLDPLASSGSADAGSSG